MGSVALLALVGASVASAADMATKAPAGYTYAPPTTTDPFTGIYIGATAGAGFNTSDHSVFGVIPASDLSQEPQGAVVGIHGGYGQRFGSNAWYLGGEADIQVANLKGSGDLASRLIITTSSKNDWFGTVRGRFGVFLMHNVMLYGTAGLAYGNADATLTISGLGTSSVSATKTGWVAGGGLEIALNDHWLARGEWMRVDLGNVSVTNGNPAILTFNSGFQADIFRGGVSYKF